MKRILLRCLGVLLGFTLLTGMMPVLASAADNELVLTKIGHWASNAVSITQASTRSVTLTVPFTYAGNTLDLSSGLTIEKASSIDSVVTSFSTGGALAAVGDPGAAGPPVTMSVTYYKGGNNVVQHSTAYSISVIRAVRLEPTFTGTITKSITGTVPNSKLNDITFSSGDFTGLYTANDGGPISNVSITGSSLSCGALKIGSGASYVNYESGRLIPIEDIGSLVFDATGNGTVSYIVSAYAGSDTSRAIGSVVLTINVNAVTAPTITASVVKSVNMGSTLVFSLSDFSSCYSLNNGTLLNIVITPAKTDCGTWYKGTGAFTGSKTFKKDEIGTLKFKAVQCGQAAFTWTVSNEHGTSAAGNGLITINAAAAVISCKTAQNTAKTFAASDFNAACKEATGAGLNHAYFTLPPAACGTLYYGYSSPSRPGTAISANTVLYYNKAPKISDLTFVPATNYTGAFTITYTGVNTKDIAYAGEIRMIVGNAGDVSYQTAQNNVRTFNAADFNRACANVTGYGLSHVFFTLPSASSGTLYYGYSSPSSPGTAVRQNSSYSVQTLSYITFVPAVNYVGTVSIPYTGVASNNTSYTGNIKITVGGLSTVRYTTDENRAVWLAPADLNTACMNLTGSKLNAVSFMLPSAADGRLYYKYSSLSSRGSAVSPDTAYRMDDAPYIGYVAFVPAADYSGTVSIAYTGSSVGGTQFTGIILIKVNGRTGSAYFTDVGSSCEWAAGAVDYLCDAGIVKGTGGNRYSPGATMTRGDFLLMLHRAMGYTGSTNSNFSDVPKGSYYYDAIAIAKALGIAQGTNNKIGPTSPLTRQDAMVYIHRALLVTGSWLTPGTSADIAPFADKGTVSNYALDAVQALVRAGMIKGSYGKLHPKAVLSRAEMAVVLYRVKITF